MSEALNVIALVSGGKDSFYSILQCIQNGHKVVALGNLYPPAPRATPHPKYGADNEETTEQGEQDLNSFMYQTVGHTVIPLYEAALGIPLYRQQIIGSAVQTGTSYSHSTAPAAGNASSETVSRAENEDETESLIPLLKRIMAEHPDANALSTGAILSTYQRTRVESVALRLGLTPLSFLWQYLILPPGTQASLLRDMQAVGLDARIIKVASGGLDESFLWENVASETGIRRVERSMKRFGMDGDGGVLGEGGEFETLVVDGPRNLFKGRIEIREEDRKVVREGGGSAWLRILDAKVVMKTFEVAEEDCRIPDILEQRFKTVLESLEGDSLTADTTNSTSRSGLSTPFSHLDIVDTKSSDLSSLIASRDNILYWKVTGRLTSPRQTISDEATDAILKIRQLLGQISLEPSSIVSTTIILRSMKDFASVNSIYGALFTAPNPPSRVTISCGSLLPKDINILIHLKVSISPLLSSSRKALHVQSRSYWAPANIGPYSQATSSPISSISETETNISAVSVAGQIPLIPATMTLPPQSPNSSPLEDFKFQVILSLQHLFRIGAAMSVSWFTGTVAYLPSPQSPSNDPPPLSSSIRARIAGQAWTAIHARPQSNDSSASDFADDKPRDLWEEKYYAGLASMARTTEREMLPDWDAVEYKEGEESGSWTPAFWAAEVEELPRGAGVEWAALEGVVGAKVTLSHKCQEGSWSIEQCRFGVKVRSVVVALYTNDSEEVTRRISEALESAGILTEASACASWLDLSIHDIDKTLEVGRCSGVVPCRSLWDASGRRLAAVLVFESQNGD